MMILILLLHVTEVFAMLLEPQTTRDRNEATFESYEGEPVFGDPRHDQYGVKEFWWDRPTSKWEPWWPSKNVSVTKWYIDQTFTTEDLSEIWKEGLMDWKTSIKETQDGTTAAYPEEASINDRSPRDTLSVLYTGTETPVMPTAAPIFLTKVSKTTTPRAGPIFLIASDEQTNLKQHQSSQVPLRGRTQDYILDLLTATSLYYVQQSAADLLALRAGAERSTFRSHPSKMDDPSKPYDVVPFDRELYRQLRGEFPPSLQQPYPNHSRESPGLKSPNNKPVKKEDKKYVAGKEKSVVLHNDPEHSQKSPVFLEDKAVKKEDNKYIDGNKSLGLHDWKLQYPGRNAAVKKISKYFPVPKDFIERLHGTTGQPSKKHKHKPYPNSFEKLIARTFKLTTQYQTSLNNAEYYDIIHNNYLMPSQKPSNSSPSNILFQHNDFQRYPNEKLLQLTTTNGYVENKTTNAEEAQYGYVDNEPPQQIQTDIQNPITINPDDPTSEALTVSTNEPTVYITPLGIDEMSIGQEDNSSFSSDTIEFTAPFPTAILPNEQDLQLPDLSAMPGQSPAPGNVRQGAIEVTATDQTLASAITQESLITSQRNTQTPDILPAAAAVRPTFTVPNMETTTVTTVIVSTTTAETTVFTLEMAPFPMPNNVLHAEIDWSQFNLGVTTTPFPPLIDVFMTEDTNSLITTVHPMVIEMRTEMVDQRIGYFTVFMRKLLDIVAKKDEDSLYAILKGATNSLNKINDHNGLMGLGRPMWPGIQMLLGYMQLLPIDTLQSQATLGHMYYKTGAMFNNDMAMEDLNNRVNALYEVREGEHLMKTLVDLQNFPGAIGEISADQVTEDIFRAMLAPYFRSPNSPAMYNVLLDLNERFETIQNRYLGGSRRNNRQKNVINWLKKPLNDSLDNGKAYVDIKNKKTVDDNNDNDTSEEVIDKFSGNKMYNIVKQQDENTKMKLNKTRSIKDKIRYNTKHKVNKTINYYNRVHHVDTVKQKRSKKYKKKSTDHKNNMRITKNINYEPSKENNKYISSSNNKKETRDKKFFKHSLKNVKINTNNKKNSKKANVYNKKQLIKRNKYNYGSKNGRNILKNKEKRHNSHNKKKTTRRNIMRTRLIIASSKEKHDDSDTNDDRSKANSRKIKSPRKKETKGNKKHKIKTSKQALRYRTTTKRNNFDSSDDEESKTIGQKVFEMEERVTPNSPTRSNLRFKIIKNFEDKSARHFASSSSFEVELKNKFHELQLLEKNLENLIKKENESRIDAKEYENKVNNSENHENVKHELSERVLQKNVENVIKKKPDSLIDAKKYENNVNKSKNHENWKQNLPERVLQKNLENSIKKKPDSLIDAKKYENIVNESKNHENWKQKLSERVLQKNLENLIKKKPARLIDAKKYESKVNNFENHENWKQKLSERVLQKNLESLIKNKPEGLIDAKKYENIVNESKNHENWKQKLSERVLQKSLENLIKKKPNSLIDAKKYESKVNNFENHENWKQKLSERVLQKNLESLIKNKPDGLIDAKKYDNKVNKSKIYENWKQKLSERVLQKNLENLNKKKPDSLTDAKKYGNKVNKSKNYENWKQKLSERVLQKNLENLIKKKPDSLIDAKKYQNKVNNFENHENWKHKLSEKVLQKLLEKKQNLDDTKNNANNSKIWQNHVSSVAPQKKIKNNGNKNLLVKESISIDFQNNTHKPVNTENKEKLWPRSKSQYILNNAATDLNEKFLDFNRDKRQTKKINILRNLDKQINILRVESSYSDEEEILKSKLQDNLLHGSRNFTDTLHKNKKGNVIRDISSYSDEEDTLKKNIYKTFI